VNLILFVVGLALSNEDASIISIMLEKAGRSLN